MKLKISMALVAAVGCLIYLQQTPKRQIVGSLGVSPAASYFAEPLRVAKPLLVAPHEVPPTTPEKIQSSIKRFITREARQLYDTDRETNSIEERLRKEVRAFKKDDINELVMLAINEHESQDERTLAVYLLTIKGPEAQESLIKVFLSPSQILNQQVPVHSIQELQQQQEYALRTMALEGIEANLHSASFHKPLGSALKQDNEYLNGLLKIVKLGEKLHRPMLKEFIDQNLNQERL